MSEAWHAYCDALRAAGDHVLAANEDASEATRAEGLLYLPGPVRGGSGQAIEPPDPARPRFPSGTYWCVVRELGWYNPVLGGSCKCCLPAPVLLR